MPHRIDKYLFRIAFFSPFLLSRPCKTHSSELRCQTSMLSLHRLSYGSCLRITSSLFQYSSLSSIQTCSALACTFGSQIVTLNPINHYEEMVFITHQASNLPIPSPPFSSRILFPPIPLFHLASFVGLVTPAATFSLLAFGLPFAHPFLLSLAHAPQEEMYAPAFCPAACTEACAAVRSGARAAKRCAEGAFSEDGSPVLELALMLPKLAISARLRWASRIASMSAQRFEKAVETFLWPVAKCLFSASLLVANLSSRCNVWICSARRRCMSSKLRFPAVGWRGSTMSKRSESV